MKKYEANFSLVIIVFFASFLLGGCSFFQKKTQPVERSEELNRPISELLKNKEEFECFIFSKEPLSRLRAKGSHIKIDGFKNSLDKKEDAEGSNFYTDGYSINIWKFKDGLRYNYKEIADLAQQGDEEAKKIQKALSVEDWINKIETARIKYTCKKASIPDEYFQIPAEVKMADYQIKKKEDSQPLTPSPPSTPPQQQEELIEDTEVENLQ